MVFFPLIFLRYLQTLLDQVYYMFEKIFQNIKWTDNFDLIQNLKNY